MTRNFRLGLSDHDSAQFIATLEDDAFIQLAGSNDTTQCTPGNNGWNRSEDNAAYWQRLWAHYEKTIAPNPAQIHTRQEMPGTKQSFNSIYHYYRRGGFVPVVLNVPDSSFATAILFPTAVLASYIQRDIHLQAAVSILKQANTNQNSIEQQLNIIYQQLAKPHVDAIIEYINPAMKSYLADRFVATLINGVLLVSAHPKQFRTDNLSERSNAARALIEAVARYARDHNVHYILQGDMNCTLSEREFPDQFHLAQGGASYSWDKPTKQTNPTPNYYDYCISSLSVSNVEPPPPGQAPIGSKNPSTSTCAASSNQTTTMQPSQPTPSKPKPSAAIPITPPSRIPAGFTKIDTLLKTEEVEERQTTWFHEHFQSHQIKQSKMELLGGILFQGRQQKSLKEAVELTCDNLSPRVLESLQGFFSHRVRDQVQEAIGKPSLQLITLHAKECVELEKLKPGSMVRQVKEIKAAFMKDVLTEVNQNNATLKDAMTTILGQKTGAEFDMIMQGMFSRLRPLCMQVIGHDAYQHAKTQSHAKTQPSTTPVAGS